MSTRISLGAGAKDGRQQVLGKDGERVLYRGLRADRTRAPHSVLAPRLIAKSPPPASLDRLAHEYGLKDHLESAWAARPLELLRDRDGTMLVLEDPGGETLDRRPVEPMEVPQFLPLAVAIAVAFGRMHQRDLVHKDPGAKAAQGWLEHQPPDLERVRRSLDRIIKDGERAREVFGRTL